MTLGYRPAEVALALLAANFQQRAALQPGHSSALMGFISELQKYCNVSSTSKFANPITRSRVTLFGLLFAYFGQFFQLQKQLFSTVQSVY
jgi:hypothetical protein